MKILNIFISVLFLSLLSSPSWSETVSWDELFKRDNTFYKKFTNTPFTGEISGRRNGKFKNGERNGLWEWYRYNGDLANIGNYKNGYRDGIWVIHNKDGTLKETRFYKDGELVK